MEGRFVMVRRLIIRHLHGVLAVGLVWCGMATGPFAQGQKTPSAATAAKRAPVTKTVASPQVVGGYDPRDLQGRWNFSTLTPWERPAGTSLEISDQEAKELEAKLTSECRLCDENNAKDSNPYNAFWFEMRAHVVRVNGKARQSMVVDPPDGRLPPVKPEARKRLDDFRRNQDQAARAEEAQTVMRCIVGFNTGPPLTPGTYGNNVEIVQNRDYVTMVAEHVHTARVFPVDGRPHTGIRSWTGDSVGRWEGNTLVVDTINFVNSIGVTDPSLHGGGNGPNAHLIERFTRIERDKILYSFTIDDPDTWTKPWTMEFTFHRDDNEAILEYACHESNYALRNNLSSSRNLEKAAAGHQKK